MCYDWGYDEEDERCCASKLLLLNRISRLQTVGITDYYVPLDAGIGLYAAEMVVALMASNPNLRLHCLIPYEDQASKWTPNLRDRYYDVLEKCTDSAPVSLRSRRTSPHSSRHSPAQRPETCRTKKEQQEQETK